MKRSYIAKRFQSSGAGLSLDTEALAKYKDIIDLSIGDTDFTTDESIINAAFRDARAGHTHYGDPKGDPELIDAVCRAWEEDFGQRLPRDHVLVSASSCLGMALVMLAILDPGDEVIVFSPYFPMYREQIELAGGVCVDVPTYASEDYTIDEARLRAAITPRTKAIVIINPNNPTGSVYPREVLEGIVEVARRHQLMIFADEIYDRLCMDGYEHVSIASLAPDLPCVTFSGLSKSHMIAGYRIGWMVLSGNQRCMSDFIMGINMLSNMRLCSNVPAQSIVQTALGGHQSVNDYIRPGGRVYEQRNFVYEALNKIDGISVVKPRAAFYIFPKMDVKKFNITDDEQFALDLLHEKKILITRGGGFNWAEPDHFRIVYLPRMEVLKESLEDLADFFDHYRQS